VALSTRPSSRLRLADEFGGEARLGAIVAVLRRPDLLDVAAIHERDAVGHLEGFVPSWVIEDR
jgi:hypothetical protein